MRERTGINLLGFVLAWALGITVAYAQPVVTRGGALKKRQYQTYANATYYVDPTGSDTNACTSTGTAACATLQGVWNKLPTLIRHAITVNVAAGSYVFDSRLAAKQFTSPVSGTTASILVEGPALSNVTPATGSATGTITSISATNNPLPVITDSAGTWTTNDLRGYFLVMTSGAQAGVAQAIVANTATTITTTTWTGTAPIVGTTFAIQRPAAIITGQQSFVSVSGPNGFIQLARVELTGTSTALTSTTVGSGMTLRAPVSRIVHSTSATAVISLDAPMWVGATAGSAANAPVVVIGAASFTRIPPNSTPNGRGFVYNANGTALTINSSTGGSLNTTTAWVAETGSATATAASIANIGPSDSSGAGNVAWTVRCPAGSTGTGLSFRGAGGLAMYNIEAVNCGTGVFLGPGVAFSGAPPSGPALTVGTSLRCTNTTTCLSVQRGPRVNLRAASTFSGVTNEYDIDGTVYTEAFFGALVPPYIQGVSDSVLERY